MVAARSFIALRDRGPPRRPSGVSDRQADDPAEGAGCSGIGSAIRRSSSAPSAGGILAMCAAHRHPLAHAGRKGCHPQDPRPRPGSPPCASACSNSQPGSWKCGTRAHRLRGRLSRSRRHPRPCSGPAQAAALTDGATPPHIQTGPPRKPRIQIEVPTDGAPRRRNPYGQTIYPARERRDPHPGE